ncbi:hypothetical protein [Leptospira weilii]|uniref:hypothetical protein n=1 Tax=Leptospira weilii TaxID=28184 RepID=UPI001EF2A8BD|nr:hypothetical protein [Leptospira weilii]ULH30391.1 hypothetical protein FH586_11405 [Leptospira weilii]
MAVMKGYAWTLKQETAFTTAFIFKKQKAFKDFQYEYNCIGLHEALKNVFPKSYTKASEDIPSVLPEAAL